MNYIKLIRIFLLVLIVIGVGLLLTQKIWVPKLVDYILSSKIDKTQISPSSNTQTVSKSSVTIISPSKDQLIDISSPMKIIWKTSNDFNFPRVTITVVVPDNNNQAAFDSVTVSNTGSATIIVPKTVGVIPYKILIQGAPYSGRGEAPFAYSDEFFFKGGIKAQMGR